MRDHTPTLGLPLPKPRSFHEQLRVLISQFADDTTLYTHSAGNMEAALTLVEDEFCAASGPLIPPCPHVRGANLTIPARLCAQEVSSSSILSIPNGLRRLGP